MLVHSGACLGSCYITLRLGEAVARKEQEVWTMRRSKSISRTQQRQEMLRELAADEASYVLSGKRHSRAVEAVDALQRIQEGTYGVCVDCGHKIPAARLQIKPEATRCVACQSDYEERSADRLGDLGNVTRRSA